MNDHTPGAPDPETEAACCVICLAEISRPCAAAPCGHDNFDFFCLATWLQEQLSCPLCKAEITHVKVSGEEGMSLRKVPSIWSPVRTRLPGRGPQAQRAYNSPNDQATSTRQSSLLTAPSSSSQLAGRRATERESEVDARVAALDRRRRVYHHQLYSLHVGSNPSSGYKDVTPRQLQADPDLIARARVWIRRELEVFEFLNHPGEMHRSDPRDRRRQRLQNTPEHLLQYVICILKIVDLQASDGHAENLLSDHLGRDNCKVFLHELRSFIRSPFQTVAEWDRHVQYNEPPSATLAVNRLRLQPYQQEVNRPV